jgi:hypothetical protein
VALDAAVDFFVGNFFSLGKSDQGHQCPCCWAYTGNPPDPRAPWTAIQHRPGCWAYEAARTLRAAIASPSLPDAARRLVAASKRVGHDGSVENWTEYYAALNALDALLSTERKETER